MGKIEVGLERGRGREMEKGLESEKQKQKEERVEKRRLWETYLRLTRKRKIGKETREKAVATGKEKDPAMSNRPLGEILAVNWMWRKLRTLGTPCATPPIFSLLRFEWTNCSSAQCRGAPFLDPCRRHVRETLEKE